MITALLLFTKYFNFKGNYICIISISINISDFSPLSESQVLNGLLFSASETTSVQVLEDKTLEEMNHVCYPRDHILIICSLLFFSHPSRPTCSPSSVRLLRSSAATQRWRRVGPRAADRRKIHRRVRADQMTSMNTEVMGWWSTMKKVEELWPKVSVSL